MERPELSISVHHTGAGEAILSLAGEIDMLTAGQLTSSVDEVLSNGTAEDGPSRVVLDMADVTFCDSQGLGTLVVLSRRVSSARSVLVLTNVADFLLRVLDITGLRSALMIRDNAAPGRTGPAVRDVEDADRAAGAR